MATPIPMSNDPSTLNSSIQRSLSSIKSDFFSALHHGPASLLKFNTAWVAFNELVMACYDNLADETKFLVYSFQATVEAVTGSLMGLPSAEDVVGKLSKEVNAILTEDLEIASALPESEHATSTKSYIELSSSWLCDNIANPYPSAQIRSSIAARAGAARKDVDAWFVDARRRIGWNHLRKKWFSNRRADIVAAATDLFNSASPPSKQIERRLENDFVAMQRKAEDLFSAKFKESELATQLDRVVKSVSVAHKGSPRHFRPSPNGRGQFAYPTPERSPEPTTGSPFSPSPILATPTLSRKRSFSPEDCQNDVQHKRQRIDEVAQPLLVSYQLPSPAASQSQLDDTASPAPSFLSRKRKRCVSDNDALPCKRPPAAIDAGIRAASVDAENRGPSYNWLSDLFTQLPDPVPVVQPDSTENLDIQLHNFDSLPSLDIYPTTTFEPNPVSFGECGEPLSNQLSQDSLFPCLENSVPWNMGQYSYESSDIDPSAALVSADVLDATPSTLPLSYSISQDFAFWAQSPPPGPEDPLSPPFSTGDILSQSFYERVSPDHASTSMISQPVPLSSFAREAKRQELEAKKLAIEAELSALG